MKLKSSVVVILILLGYQSIAQYEGYTYKRKLSVATPGWYQFELPNDLYGKINVDFSDIRIIGVNNKDTIQAPYLLDVMTNEYVNDRVEFTLLNKVFNSKGYYYTFAQSDNSPINHIDLEFESMNYDWRVDLEGSNDQKEWFTIVKGSRILSVQNEFASYKYNKLNFDNANYQYYRLRVPTSGDPQFISAVLSKSSVIEGDKELINLSRYIITEDKKTHQTIMTIDLKMHLPVSLIKLEIKDTIDYYRPVYLSYVRDSIKTDNGWKYVYNSLKSDVISSLEPAEFTFPNTIAKQIKVKISNGDNQSLKIVGSQMYGDVHRLLVRISEPATYYLVYGNVRASVPNYDINRFTDHIPDNPGKAELSDEMIIKKTQKAVNPLFENNWILWSIMIITILILGWFSFKMIRTK